MTNNDYPINTPFKATLPNGQKGDIKAIESTDEDSCGKCLYGEVPCEDLSLPCIPSLRKDKKDVYFVKS